MEKVETDELVRVLSTLESPPAHLVQLYLVENQNNSRTGEPELAQFLKFDLLLGEAKYFHAFLVWEQTMITGVTDSLILAEGFRRLTTLSRETNAALHSQSPSLEAIQAYERLHEIGQDGPTMSVEALRWYIEYDHLEKARPLCEQLLQVCPNHAGLAALEIRLAQKLALNVAKKERGSNDLQ
jgi:hypothetical protein